MIRWLQNLYRNEDAATAVEYSVLLALILMGVIATIGAVGNQAGGLWGGIDSDLAGTEFGQQGGP